jgi:Rrf2 family protein
MKFTAQEEYGLRCILQIARKLRLENTPAPAAAAASAADPSLTVAEIARFEGLTTQYAGKLVSILVKAKLLESARGRGGGVRLTRPPYDITVAEVLSALGGALYENETCERYTGGQKFCVHNNDCALRSLWSGLQAMIDRVLSRTTLADLCANETTMAQWIKSHEDACDSFQPIQGRFTFIEKPTEV